MRLTEVTYDSAQPIDSYGPGFFRVGGHVLQGASLITPWDAGPWGGLTDTAVPLTLAGRIDVPTLLVHGTQDSVVPPSMSRALAADIPDAQRVLIDGRTHNDLWEEPSACLESVARFALG